MTGTAGQHWPVPALLALRSSEASLICERGHIAGHPHTCPDGCTLTRTDGTASDVIAYKASRSGIPLDKPVTVEDGWLIDGHHRLLRAVENQLETLPVREVTGVLDQQRAYHQQVRTAAAQADQP